MTAICCRCQQECSGFGYCDVCTRSLCFLCYEISELLIQEETFEETREYVLCHACKASVDEGLIKLDTTKPRYSRRKNHGLPKQGRTTA